MTELPQPEKVWTQEEIKQLRQTGRQIGADDLALTLYDRLDQEIALCKSMIRQKAVDEVDNQKWLIRMNTIMSCSEILGELNDVRAPKTKETDKK